MARKRRLQLPKRKLTKISAITASCIVDQADLAAREEYTQPDMVEAIRVLTIQRTKREPTKKLIMQMLQANGIILDSPELDKLGVSWDQYYGKA